MTDKAKKNLMRRFPEIGAGGFTRFDGSIEFFTRVNALVDERSIVLDFGAGRGRQMHDDPSALYRSRLARLKGRVAHIAGADVDEAVLDNPFLDESHLIKPGEALPFPDAHFDLIYADWVLEHVAEAESFADQVRRVLKPGGWFCGRTPNRWGFTGLGATLIPNHFHAKLLKRLQPGRQEEDVFPTAYRMNTLRHIRKYFDSSEWLNYSYLHTPEAGYVQTSRSALRFAETFLRHAPQFMGTNVHVFVRKR